MYARRNLFRLAFALVLVAGFSLAMVSCADSDDDDDDDESSYGLDIQGLYNGVVSTTYDDCPGEADPEANWIFEIEQKKTLDEAEVFWRQEGPSSGKTLLFKGDVYGDTILRVKVEKDDISEGDCLQVMLVDYRITVDRENVAIYGLLHDDTFYLGNGCPSSVTDCRTVREIAPEDPPETDDDDDDTV